MQKKKNKIPKCPSCGNDGNNDLHPIQWVEMVPSHRRVLGIIDGILYIDESYKDYGEAGASEHLFCQKCCAEWSLPTGPSRDFIPEGDYIKLAKYKGIECEEG